MIAIGPRIPGERAGKSGGGRCTPGDSGPREGSRARGAMLPQRGTKVRPGWRSAGPTRRRSGPVRYKEDDQRSQMSGPTGRCRTGAITAKSHHGRNGAAEIAGPPQTRQRSKPGGGATRKEAPHHRVAGWVNSPPRRRQAWPDESARARGRRAITARRGRARKAAGTRPVAG